MIRAQPTWQFPGRSFWLEPPPSPCC
jgi:hypothetical protein